MLKNIIGKRSSELNFILFTAVVILINIVSSTLFFRIDLTGNRKFSLSDASKKTVKAIEEPLTVKAFFSENLPGTYSNLKREVTDLLEEYSLAGNDNFNFQVYTIDREGTAVDETGENIKDLAESYSIYPVQIQNVENDEVKLLSVYMGIAVIHGNMMETIPSLNASSNLEYILTGTIDRISRKISALVSLDKDINVDLYLSSSLFQMGEGLSSYPGEIENTVSELNSRNYGRIEYSYIDPDKTDVPDDILDNLKSYTLSGPSGEGVKVYADIAVTINNKTASVTLLRKNLFGYDIVKTAELSDTIDGLIDKLLNMNRNIGYLTDKGTLPLYQNPYAQNQQAPSLNNFISMVSDNYTISPVTDLSGGIPDSLESLIIVSPSSPFTDWELYQIDQYIMKGNSVAFFIDTFNEVYPENQNPYNPQPPKYVPRDTGLEKLLNHYGIDISSSFILDENCYKRTSQDASGNLMEISYYFAPEIKSADINKKLPFLNNIKGLLMLNISPLQITGGSSAQILFSSSPESWEMSDNINLYNPMMIIPPSEEERDSYPLAAYIDGKMESYFRGKNIPEQELKEGESLLGSEVVSAGDSFIPETEEGRIFVTGTSTILTDNVLDQGGSSPNSVFIYNILDQLNSRQDFARMRSKGQTLNPIRSTTPGERSFIKSFNIAGLPILTALAGIFAWIIWNSRKKKIEEYFRREK